LRVLLFTGKGGVGKSTVAAASAVRAARSGRKVLALSADSAHSLGDALGVEVGHEPVEVETGLFVAHVDAQRRFERSWREVQDYLLSVLDAAGVDEIAAEELTVLPGAEEVLALLELRDQARSGRWDAVVVDCAPTAETLRLLALPEALGWYMDRVFPVERRLMRAMRPVLGKVAGVPMPRDRVFDAVERLHRELLEVREVLGAAGSSVRLVLTPESVVVAEARRTWTSLSLYGYRVDAVVANRLLPPEVSDPWFDRWKALQAEHLETIDDGFAPVPVLRAELAAEELVGFERLRAFGALLYEGVDPAAVLHEGELLQVETAADGRATLVLPLPFAERDDLDLGRHDDELLVRVGPYRRVVLLPDTLRRRKVVGAALRDGTLRVTFEQARKTA
jgi:arsenite/tail-anchored protein-transporting ATPase